MVLGFTVALDAAADSPLTSIELGSAYADLPAIKALAHGRTQAAYELLSSNAPSGEKLAVMSALGWGKRNAERYEGTDPFVRAFLQAMDDYLEVKPETLARLDQAAAERPDDFAVQYAVALVHSQEAMQGSWCDVYKGPSAVLERFAPARRNLRPKAVAEAQDYLRGYAEYCEGSPEQKAKHHEELNQIYTLARLNDQVVAGTQGGVVVWSTRGGPPLAIHEGFICTTEAIGGAVWAGCESEVLKWDGHTFKSYLPRKAKNTSVYYQPMRGRDGAVWVRLGAKLFALSNDRFEAVPVPWKKDPYDAVARKNGDVWWIDFMRAIVVGERTYALHSADYPGTDPRRIEEDPQGTLWVEDFESGLFELLPDGRFVRRGSLSAKASGVARDGARLIALHYTDGLMVGDKALPLPDLEYMRDLERDADGTLWVAGWHGFLKLRPDGSSWGRQLFKVE
jgi:hypothetical protein